VIDELAQVVDIQQRDRRRYKRLLDESKSFESLPIRTKLTDEEVARFMAQRYRFPGVEVRARLFRHYPLGEAGAHLIGYIGRINQTEKKQIEDWDEDRQSNYKGTEYIGKLGLEQAYEDDLHGTTGFEEVETSAGGRAVRSLNSHGATPGNTLRLSVDIKLQALVEEMFGNRRGALVAIDPRNGEVLALVSKPTFDPNLFVDGIDSENWRELNESIEKPLLNRALRGTYPPGSTFKPFMAMAALNSGKRGPNTVIYDGGTFQFGNHTFRSHGDKGLGPVDMSRSIVKSSNVYYYSLANDLGVDLMYEQLLPFGFGRKTGIDIDGEVTGLLPSTEWKRRAYRKPEQQRWYAGETISLGIGQGYNNFTALQLATATATLVSGGQRFKPRLVSDIEDIVTRERKRVASDAIEPLPFKREHVELITKAMHGVTQEGTSVRSFLGAPYKTGGKTGTAQAVSIKQNEKYNASKLEEHQRDHSLYIAFAPVEAPTVALAVIVENSGFGSEAAAPMARRVFDYVLLGLVPSAEDMALTQQGKSGPITGKQRPANDYVLPGSPAAAAAVAAPPPPAVRVAERVR
jgi:penicillin-binding protein 2